MPDENIFTDNSLSPTSDDILRQAIIDELRPSIEADVRAEMEPRLRAEFQVQLEKAVEERTEAVQRRVLDENKVALEKVVAEYKKSMTPPSADEIGQMLNAEYLSFPFPLRIKGTVRKFELGELSSAKERRFLKLMKEKLGPFTKELESLTFRIAEGDIKDKITEFFTTIEPTTGLISSTVHLILTAYPEGEDLTLEDVEDGVSLSRQLAILQAQAQCNRLRDFFSSVSRSFKL